MNQKQHVDVATGRNWHDAKVKYHVLLDGSVTCTHFLRQQGLAFYCFFFVVFISSSPIFFYLKKKKNPFPLTEKADQLGRIIDAILDIRFWLLGQNI